MTNAPLCAKALLAKLKALPPERLAQVADFVEFLRTQKRRVQVGAALRAMWTRLPKERRTHPKNRSGDK